MTPIIAASGLTKTFGRRWTLNVDGLTINAGDGIYLGGNNGAGKTTLLKIISGLLSPNAVSYLAINGNAQKKFPCGAPFSVYLHQTPYLFSTSIKRNVEYGLRRCHQPTATATKAIEWAGLASHIDSRADKLSGGEQGRCALARIAALSPRLVLLDEPTAHLDTAGVKLAVELVQNIRDKGNAVIIVAHDSMLFSTNRRWYLTDGELSEKQ